MLLYLAFLLPLAGGAILPLFHFRTVKSRGIYVESVVLATSALVWYLILTRTGETQVLYWMRDELAISFRMDGMGCVFAGLVAVLWPLASLYGFEYMKHEERPNIFFVFYTMTYGIVLAIATSANLFTLYIFYECLTMITLPLVVHKQDKLSVKAGRMYVGYSVSCAAMAFIALAFTVMYGSGSDFALGGIFTSADLKGNRTLLQIMYLLAFIGFGTKAAVFPFHAWLPAASAAPTPVTALLHAVAVVNTGVFAVLRITYYTFGTELLFGSWVQLVVLGMACFTVVYACTLAVKEQHFKRRLAYSTVSNMSYMLMGAALMTPEGMVGSLTHLVMHGLMKITLFYCAGAVMVQTGHEYVQSVRGLGKVMPFTCAVFTLGSLGMVGIPPLCGFVSKWNLLTAAAQVGLRGMVGIIALIISSVLTAIYLFGVAFPMYFRPLNQEDAAFAGTNRDPGWMMKLPLAILSVAMIVMGLWSGPLVEFLRGIAAGTIF